MKSRILYCAEPIDQSDHGAWKESVAAMVGVAVKRGWVVYRPARAFAVGPDTPVGPEIEMINRAVLGEAGAVFAHLPSGVPSVGVPREVEWALANGVSVLVVSDNASSWSLADAGVIEIGDTPTFGKWLVELENGDYDRDAMPLVFTVDSGQIPTRTNDGDAGYDLYVSEDTYVEPGQFVDIPCGIRVALPGGTWARITGRSSTLRKRHLMVAEGVIDTGYRGPLFSGVWNMGEDTELVRKGERIAQLILHDNVSARFEPVAVDAQYYDRIPGDSRGAAGFGSTGV